MPPPIKYTKDAIITAALDVIRKNGFHGLNARNIAKELGCSTQPIFRTFATMEEIKASAYTAAESIYNKAMFEAERKAGFLGMGLAYIQFAKDEPKLFHFLFLSDTLRVESIEALMMENDNQEVTNMISQQANISIEQAEQLFTTLWLLAHGTATLVATNELKYDMQRFSKILSDTFNGLLTQFHDEGSKT